MSALVKRKCRGCKKQFEVYQSKIDQGKGKYCSKRCFYEHRRASRPREAICRQCGSSFRAKPHRIERGEALYCSRKCFRESQKRDLEEVFWSQVQKSDGCWLWTGPVNSGNGYGRFGFEMEQLYAHRVSFELHHGPIPDGGHVLHHCDHPLCVRPDHIYLGQHEQNMADRDSRDRVRHGEQHPYARLSEDDVRAIRAEYATGETTYRALAARWSTSHQNISDIVKKRTWKRVI